MNSEEKLPVEPETTPEAASVQEAAPEIVNSGDPILELTAERDDLKDQMLRMRAEMENFRRRLNRERDDERRYASLPIVRDLLPAIDNLERAVAAGQKDPNVESLLQGVQMVLKQMEEILGRFGVKSIPSVGEAFDPNVHEALQQVPSTEFPPMTVVQELERGFQLHDRVIRPTKVIVSSEG